MREVDTRGTHCPGPLVEAIRLIGESPVGDTISVIADESESAGSIPVWVARSGHTLARVEQLEDGRRYVITRNR